MPLKIDFKDDVFDGNRKYTLLNNADGTVSLIDATTYQQEGSSFGATNINDTNKEINNTTIFETAGGTATGITLSGIILENGKGKTFIVKTNNNSAATTINGKNFYKPGTTTSPNLIAGKAVTVWYNATSNCFFIKASAEGSAIVDNVLAEKTFSNDNDTGLVGTMPNNGAVSITPGTIDKPIPLGYHNGSGKAVGDPDLVSANIKAGVNIFGVQGNVNVVDTSAGDAVAGDMLYGKKAYVDGALITGSISSKTAASITPGIVDQSIGAGQYLSGAQTIKGDTNLIASNILSGKSIFGVAGNVIAGKRVINGSYYLSGTSNNYSSHYNTITIPLSLGFTPSKVFVWAVKDYSSSLTIQGVAMNGLALYCRYSGSNIEVQALSATSLTVYHITQTQSSNGYFAYNVYYTIIE
jgi:hypothetical protein